MGHLFHQEEWKVWSKKESNETHEKGQENCRIYLCPKSTNTSVNDCQDIGSYAIFAKDEEALDIWNSPLCLNNTNNFVNECKDLGNSAIADEILQYCIGL